MTRFHRRTDGAHAAALAVAFLAPPLAAAQQYRVLELDALPGGEEVWPYGINNDGAIVGQAADADGKHAFVWLPAPLYGFNCRGPYDLHDLAPATPLGDSIAYEINKTIVFGQGVHPAGQIAGQAGGVDGDAFVWTLADGNATAINLSSYGGGLLTTTAAYGINDAGPAVVVGDGVGITLDCHEVPKEVVMAFRAVLDGSNQLEVLDHLSLDKKSQARDVSTSSPTVVAGLSDFADPTCIGASSCDEPLTPVFWYADPGDPTALPEIIALWGGQALGVNDASDLVGYGQDEGSPPAACHPNAALWRAPAHDEVINLGDEGGLSANTTSVANAIANVSPLQVVGRRGSGSSARALLWAEGPAESWDVVELEGAACDCDSTFVLREARDINDEGWIIALGVEGGAQHAFLLRPIADCPADLDGDGFVDVKDWSILMANPGPCPLPACDDLCCECRGDLNGDCTRDHLDQAILLQSRGPCPGFGICATPEGASAPPSLEEGIDALGFDGVEGYLSWLAGATDEEALSMGWLLVDVVTP